MVLLKDFLIKCKMSLCTLHQRYLNAIDGMQGRTVVILGQRNAEIGKSRIV